MKYFIFSFLLMCSCSNQDTMVTYSNILSGLSKNYILLYSEIKEDLFYEHYELDQGLFKKIEKEYDSSIQSFYSADKDIIPFLLQFRADTTTFCSWISTINPFKSNIDIDNLYTKSEGALVLIDNYLSSDALDRIIINDYVNSLSFELIESFYSKNEDLSKGEIRKLYKQKIVPKY